MDVPSQLSMKAAQGHPKREGGPNERLLETELQVTKTVKVVPILPKTNRRPPLSAQGRSQVSQCLLAHTLGLLAKQGSRTPLCVVLADINKQINK